MNRTKIEMEYYKKYRNSVMLNLGITLHQFNALKKLGNKLNLLYIRQCNGYTQEFFEKQDDERREKWEKWGIDYTGKLGLYIYYQTDPRGAVIYVDTKEIPRNNYNNAVCIY
jgi:hypothetical protein